MNEQTLKNALKYYHIKNQDYLEKCLVSLKELNQNPVLKKKILEIRKRMLKDDYYLKSLWNKKELEDILSKKEIPFLTNIILLSCFKTLKKNHRKFSKKDLKKIEQRIKETLTNDIYIRGYESIRISQLLWGIYLTKSRIIEVGRLQYELSFINPLTNIKENVIKIHIPRGKELLRKEVIKSLNKAPKKIKKYFKLENSKYYCSSWLLSEEINNIVDDNSNIKQFTKLFDIKKGEECTSDILNFVCEQKECDDYHKLPENTSLQKKIKECLLEGKKFFLGIGLLKK